VLVVPCEKARKEHRLPNRKRKPGKIFEKVPTYAVPSRLFDSFGYLTLRGADLSVYLYCCLLANKKRDEDGQFVFEIKSAEVATGYCERQIWRALIGLQGNPQRTAEEIISAQQKPLLAKKKPLIVKVSGGKFLPNTYSISTEEGFRIGIYRGDKKETLRGMLYSIGLGYFDVPCHLMDRLRELKGAPLAVVLTGIKQAIDQQHAKFVAILKEWKCMAGITKDTVLRSAWECKTVHDLMRVSHKKGQRTAGVELFDPVRGTSLTQNMPEAMDRAAEKAAISAWEADRKREYTQQELEQWFLSEFPEAEKRDDEFCVDCPECHGMRQGKRTPTLRVRFDKGGVGVMACHAFIKKLKRSGDDVFCSFETKGKVPYHLMAMRDRISPRQALQRMRNYILLLRGERPEEIDSEGTLSISAPADEIPI
jgi:hypothetical protein